MKKQFFSLIRGDSIRVAPDTKVIAKDAFSELLDSAEVLKLVKDDAEIYRRQVVDECEVIKQQAAIAGFAEGYKEWLERIAALEEEFIKIRQELEKILVPVALAASKKIVGREIELSDNTIVDIIAASLRSVSQHKRIVIYVNKEDVEILEKNKPRLKELFESLEILSIRPRQDIAPAGCVIETEGGIINAQLEHQWKTLENALEKILNKRKKSKDEVVKTP